VILLTRQHLTCLASCMASRPPRSFLTLDSISSKACCSNTASLRPAPGAACCSDGSIPVSDALLDSDRFTSVVSLLFAYCRELRRLKGIPVSPATWSIHDLCFSTVWRETRGGKGGNVGGRGQRADGCVRYFVVRRLLRRSSSLVSE